jgi:hypothetical protein
LDCVSFSRSFCLQDVAKVVTESRKIVTFIKFSKARGEFENHQKTVFTREQVEAVKVEAKRAADAKDVQGPARADIVAEVKGKPEPPAVTPFTPKGLLTAGDTRWNSDFRLWQRFLEPIVREAIGLTLYNKFRSRQKDQQRNLSDQQWEIVEELVKFLGNFAKVTDRFGGQSYLTISTTHKYIRSLSQHCSKFLADASLTAAVRDAVKRCLDVMNEKFSEASNSTALAMILDPRYKSLSHLELDSQNAVIQMLAEELVKFGGDEGAGAAAPAPKRVKVEDPDALLMAELEGKDIEVPEVKMPSTDQELNDYLAEKEIKGDSESVLSWWRTKSVKYPRLSCLARFVLAIPASSCPSERLFSKAGCIVTPKRSSLDDDNVDTLSMLSGNPVETLATRIPMNEGKEAKQQ